MDKANTLVYEEISSQHFTSTRNACKLCSPLGASIVFRGIENCIPLIHGSQGCSTYIRRYIISHYKEPVDIASSNFSEEAAIFGGGDNLKRALNNLIRQYNPDTIGIASTCLSETIGDDVKLYLDQYGRERVASSIPVIIHASTPSYRGTHMEGFHEAVLAVVRTLAEGGTNTTRINVLPGFLSTEDLRHLKEILLSYRVPFTLLPDYSETLDGESWADYQKLPAGGTPLGDIKEMGRASATIQFSPCLSSRMSASQYLEKQFGVKSLNIGIPIGVRRSDIFFRALETVTGLETPARYIKERGRLVDSYIDGHKYVSGKKAVIYGEADFVASMASFLEEIGIIPVLCATGAVTGTFKETVLSCVTVNHEGLTIVEDTDFVTMLEMCRTMKPDIIIGNSKGYFLSRRLGIPLVRVGFPIHDRLGGQRILHIGYRGSQQLFDRIVNTFIESSQEKSNVGYSYI